MKLLFMDEAVSEHIKGRGRITVLSGVLIAVSEYARVRGRFYEQFRQSKTANRMTVQLPPMELHGRRLLPDASDDAKIVALDKVTRILTEFDLAVYRVGFLTDRSFGNFFKSKTAVYGLAWVEMVSALQGELSEGPIVPIADAGNSAMEEHLCRFVANLDHLREAGYGPALSIRHSENIIGEVFFGDSRYSVFVQLADIVSYLRLQLDMNRVDWPASDFKEKVLSIARKLDPVMRHERVAEATMEGSRMVFQDLS